MCVCVVFGITTPSRLFHYFTGKSKYCLANNSKEAFRVQKRNVKDNYIFFLCFGLTVPSGLFHYFKGKKKYCSANKQKRHFESKNRMKR